jgi:Zn-dependent peptidase ImmA (M78 family)
LAAKSILKRGFKTKAEKLAIEYREKLNIHPCAPLCAFQLAEHLAIIIYSATEFVKSTNEINILSGVNGNDCEWSALTMNTKSGDKIIIHNPFHSVARQQSDLMHELAHIICKHERNQSKYDFEIPFGMRHFDEVQEEEAKCLGATLQITRAGLLWARKRNMTTEEIAAHFNASTDMVKYRMNTSGVDKQMYYIKRNR